MIEKNKFSAVKMPEAGGSASIGALPGLNQPMSGNPSLAEYGTGPSMGRADSSLVQLKMKKNFRLNQEAGMFPRHKSSLAKQFKDEVLSPVRTDHLMLDYAAKDNHTG